MPKKEASGTKTNIGSDALKELALDLRWSWHHGADELWSELDPELWALTHNPWVVLQVASPARLGALVARPAYRERVEQLLEQRREYLASAAWFQQHHARAPLTRVAYFSMEFTLSEALPIYSGGLGNVAGDQLKAASDLGVPVVGVGLLYQQGYFRQVIGADGSQQALYPYNDPAQLPITPARGPGGEWLRLSVELPGYPDLAPRLAGAGRAGPALPARQQRPRQSAGHPRHHQRAVRRRAGAAPAAGARAGDRRVARCCAPCGWSRRSATSTRGMRPSRSWSAPGPSWRTAASPSRWPWRSRGPATCSPPTRRWRPASIASPRRSSSSTWAGMRGSNWASSPAVSLRSDGRIADDPRRAIQHGVPRHPRQRGGQRRQPPARRGEPPPLPVALSAVARDRGAGGARHQWRPHAHVGLGRGRRALDQDLRRRAVARHHGDRRTGRGPCVR